MTSGVMRGVRRWCLSFPLLLILLTRLIFSPVFHTVLVFSSCSLSSSFLLSFTVFVYSSYCLSLFFSFTLSLFSPLLCSSLLQSFYILLLASSSPSHCQRCLLFLSVTIFSLLDTVLFVCSPYASRFLLSSHCPCVLSLSVSLSPFLYTVLVESSSYPSLFLLFPIVLVVSSSYSSPFLLFLTLSLIIFLSASLSLLFISVLAVSSLPHPRYTCHVMAAGHL